jgi:hypothetical protein
MEPDLSTVLAAYADGELPPEALAALGPDVGNHIAAAAILRAMPLGEVPNALVAVAGGRK